MGTFGDLSNIQEEKQIKDSENKSEKSKDDKMTSKQDDKMTNVQSDPFEDIRKMVKDVGKDIAPLRITHGESELLEDTIYDLKRTFKLRTDKTQVVRCSLNYLLNDYQQNGEDSILVMILERLNA